MNGRSGARPRAKVSFLVAALIIGATAVPGGTVWPTGHAQASTFPGTAGKIAYVSSADGGIHLVSPDGTGDTLVLDPVDAGLTLGTTVAGSPDGGRILFEARADGGTTQNDIYVVNVDGTGLRRLTTNTADEVQPAWSPNGTIFYRLRVSPERLFRMNADGSSPTLVTVSERLEPSISPNGQKILHAKRGSAGRVFISTISVTGSSEVVLTNDTSATVASPSWSPDGGTIVYTRTPTSGLATLWLMGASGANQRELVNPGSPFNDRYGVFSPDGTKIAVARNDGAGTTELYVLDADGSGATSTGIHLAGSNLSWLPAFAVVSGRVVDASGHGIGGIHVAGDSPTLVNPPGTDPGHAAETVTGADGTYRLRFEGDVTDQLIEFSDPNGVYDRQWYAGRSTTAGVTLVSATLGATTGGVDATLGLRTDFTTPEVTLIQPPGNTVAAYEVGQAVPFLYSCADEAGGSGLRTCDGFVASPPGVRIAAGDNLPTSVTGVFLLNVDSEDWAGNWTGSATQYRVFSPWIDNDGVAAATEDAAPNAGDANGDGIADGQQANVVSLPNAHDGRYITLDVARWDSFEHVQSTNPTPPAGETLSVGALAFDIVLPDFYGDSVPVTLHLPAGTHPDKYYEQDAGGAWVDISDEVTFSGDTVTRSFVDGGPGDSDGSWNGRIVVRPGGPVGVAADTTAPTISITSPVAGTYDLGQPVAAGYTCSDPMLASCVGDVANGAEVNTASSGAKTFTVNATDTSSNIGAATVSYTVSNVIATALLPSGSMSITAVNGNFVSVSDSADPLEGVTITVTDPNHTSTDKVVMSVCGGFTVRIAPGSTVTLTCGSIRARVTTGSVELVTPAGSPGHASVLVGSGGSAELDENGTVAVAPNSTAVVVTAGGVTQTVTAGTTSSWRASGYYQPVDMGDVWNTMKAGATVPMKFELFYGPKELTDASLVASTVAQVSCPTSGVTTDDVEELTSLTGLRYDTTAGEFHLNWKSPSTRGSCWKVTVAQGNATLTALFKLR